MVAQKRSSKNDLSELSDGRIYAEVGKKSGKNNKKKLDKYIKNILADLRRHT